MQNRAIIEDHFDRASGGHFEGCRVRAVLFRLLRHQADVLHCACGRWVQRAIFFEELNGFVIDRGIRVVGNDAVCIALFAVRPPTFAACADQRGHGCVNNHVRGNMQVGDAFVAVHHIHGRALVHACVNRGHDLRLALYALKQVAQAGIRVHTKVCHFRAVDVEDRFEKDLNRVTKDDRVGNLHHRGFHVQGEERALFLGARDFLREERIKGGCAHEGRIDNCARGVADALFQNSFACCCFQHDLSGCLFRECRGFLVREEVAACHRRHTRFACACPRAHAVRVALRVAFDSFRRAAIRVAFAQNRVNGRTFDRVVFRTDRFFRFGGWRFWVIRKCETLRLQFFHGFNQLRHRG